MACCIQNQHIWDTTVCKVLACNKAIDRYAVAVKKDRTIILIIGHSHEKIVACFLALPEVTLPWMQISPKSHLTKHKLASCENVQTIIAIHCKMYFVYNIFMV